MFLRNIKPQVIFLGITYILFLFYLGFFCSYYCRELKQKMEAQTNSLKFEELT